MRTRQTFFAGVLGVAGLGVLTQGCVADGGDCSGICGCGIDTTLTFTATVQDVMTGMPLADIELYCHGEDTPISTSDTKGGIGFSIETQELPGCGFARCTNLRLHDPKGAKADVEGTYYELNNTTVNM